MPTQTQRRHQLIHSLLAPHADFMAEDAMNLWEQLTNQLISTIGEGGFSAIYTRSVLLSQSSFPWLEAHFIATWDKNRFGELKTKLQGQTPEQASAANRLLLITFTDILAALIGEPLVNRILCSAWGCAAENSRKEFKNE